MTMVEVGRRPERIAGVCRPSEVPSSSLTDGWMPAGRYIRMFDVLDCVCRGGVILDSCQHLSATFFEIVVDSLQPYTTAATNRYLDKSGPWTLLNRITTQ